jgi:hypothetical protein
MGCVCGVGLKVGMWVQFTYDNILLPTQAQAQAHPYNAYHLKLDDK